MFTVRPRSPLWYRGWAYDPDEVACKNVEDVLSRTGTRRLIMGHTPDFEVSTLQHCPSSIVMRIFRYYQRDAVEVDSNAPRFHLSDFLSMNAKILSEFSEAEESTFTVGDYLRALVKMLRGYEG